MHNTEVTEDTRQSKEDSNRGEERKEREGTKRRWRRILCQVVKRGRRRLCGVDEAAECDINGGERGEENGHWGGAICYEMTRWGRDNACLRERKEACEKEIGMKGGQERRSRILMKEREREGRRTWIKGDRRRRRWKGWWGREGMQYIDEGKEGKEEHE